MPSSVRILLLGATILLLAGCVWLRLLDLKGQFADFDRNIHVPDGPGVELQFTHPVLLADDLDTLVRGEPTAVTQAGKTTVRSYAFTHIPSPDGPDPAGTTASLVLTATIVDGRVTALGLPEPVFKVVPRSIALAGMRSLGKAAVDTGTRSASTHLDLAGISEPLPHRAALIALLGTPNNVLPVDGRERVLWRYQLNGKSLREDGKPVIAAMAVGFYPGEDQPARFQINISGMWLYLDLPRQPPQVAAVPQQQVTPPAEQPIGQPAEPAAHAMPLPPPAAVAPDPQAVPPAGR